MAERESRSAVQPQRVPRNGRRSFRRTRKQSVPEVCPAPGASIAAVSMAHGFHADLARWWIRQAVARDQVPAALMPVTVDANVAPVQRESPAGTRRAATSSAIEMEYAEPRLVVRGDVDRARLHAVLEALARHR